MSRIPLSIDDLVAKQKAEKEQESKPKFLTKAERQKLALEKREAEVKAQREKEEEAKRARQELETEARRARNSDGRDRGDRREYGKDRTDYGSRNDSGRDRNGGQYRNGGSTREPVPSKSTSNASSSLQKEAPTDSFVPIMDPTLNATRYLGAKVPDKRKNRRAQGNKKFVFDWDTTDDTLSTERDPLYRPDATPVPLAGNRKLAGLDTDIVRRKTGRIDDRHWSKKALSEMTERDWRIFREDFSIAARGGRIPNPLRSWNEGDIPAPIVSVIEDIGYKEPSAIQRQAIPIGLQNRDIIGIAETGSGKTAAFLIPMLAYIMQRPPLDDDNKGQGPYALVLAPTRELAQQIESETNKFVQLLGFRCVSIVGGRSIDEQQTSLSEGAEIVIATPGRLQDCLERHILVLSQCNYVVMDEADRMVSLGFEEVLNFILDSLPSELKSQRQTIMFSATMPPPVERLAKTYLNNPAYVTIGVAGQAVDTVEQRIEMINTEEKKKQRLVAILNSGQYAPPIIVFVNTKKACDVLQKELQKARWHATTLHSGKNQEQREASLQSLRDGTCDVLVATDLAGRGIDVPDVSLVVNFEMSNHIEAYIHRIGRTGRAGKRGTAITFLSDHDEELFYDLKNEVSKSPVSKCPPELARHPAAQTKISYAMKKRAAELDD